MITIRNWIATIPEEDKHIGYLGEDGAVYRKFLITDWEAYRNWVFYLDMAFDLSSVTSRDSRQVVSTQEDVTETVAETQVKTAKTGKKETYTKETVTVNAPAQTDVAYLSRKETEEGLVLTWKVLAQQTRLPGKLYANLRAEGPVGEVKKSARMVFEVDPAVVAEPAAEVTQSAFDAMKEDINALCQTAYEQAAQTAENAGIAVNAATEATEAAGAAQAHRQVCEEAVSEVQQSVDEARHAAEDAGAAADTAIVSAGQAQIASEAAAGDAALAQENRVVAANAAAKVLYLKDVAESYEYGKNLYDAQKAHIGYKLMFGTLKESAEHITTDYIPYTQVGGVSHYVVSASNAEEDEPYTVALYDAALNFLYMLSTCKIGEAVTFDDTVAPYNQCAYMRFHFRRTLTDLQIEVGETVTAYEPYRAPMVKRACLPVDTELDAASGNPVANSVVTAAIADTNRRIAALAQSGAGGAGEYNRISVRDYGAVGDGVADDRQAILDAFHAAQTMLPCEVYFPAGTYGISSGITIEMEYGTGGLHVCGAGCDITAIRYLDDYTSQYGWYAIRIWPVGRPDRIPAEDDYLHDISYTGLTVYDPDPIGHALHTAKGDPATEETHGIDIHCCKGVSVTDCQFITVGDEAIDICFCHDVVVINNRLVGSPGAGPGGGAICIGDGCKGAVVCGNTVNGSAPDEVLDDGTVIKKSNCGISIESLEYPVQDVTVIGNSIRNVHGKGVCMSANAKEAAITNAIVADNVISGCDTGIIIAGSMLKDNVKITNNVIADCVGRAIETITVGNITISGNTICNVKGDYAIHAAVQNSKSRQFIVDNVLENLEYGGVYCGGNVVLKDCVFNGLGTAETAPSANTYGVYKVSGTLTVSGCSFKNVRMAVLKSCLHSVDCIDSTDIEVVNKDTGVADGGGYSIAGTATKRIIGCSLIGGVAIHTDGAIVQGTKFFSIGSAHTITVSANRVSIVGCIIENNSGVSSYRAIHEADGYNYNLFANNIVNRKIATTGAQSVAVNNIDTRVTA